MDKRFDTVYKEGSSLASGEKIILVDRETGVHYLFVQCGYGGGLTPLLDSEGKPVIRKDVSGHGGTNH